MTGKVSSPGHVGLLAVGDRARDRRSRSRSPAASERSKSSPASGSTPMIARVRARAPSAAVAQPAMQPAAADGRRAARRAARRPRSARARRCPGRPSRAGRRTGGSGSSPRSATSAAASSSRSPRVAVVGHDLGAVAARRGELARGRVLGHQDHRGRCRAAGPPAPPPARGCPRTRSPRRARAVLGAQRGDRVVGAAELERAHALQVLGLQQHPPGPGGARRARPR